MLKAECHPTADDQCRQVLIVENRRRGNLRNNVERVEHLRIHNENLVQEIFNLHVNLKGYTQAQLADVLDEYQPSVSNVLRGKISQVSIEKLLRYADRLHLHTSIAIRSIEGRSRSHNESAKTNSATLSAKTRSSGLAPRALEAGSIGMGTRPWSTARSATSRRRASSRT